MPSILGIMTAAGGLFLFLWYRTIAGLPAKQRPPFLRPALFKWGIPAVSLLVFASGIVLMASVSLALAAGAAGVSGLLAFLIIRFDRYSASMRLIHDRYCRVRRSNPGMEEIEALFQTAAWRYPDWSHDRLVELVAGKNVEDLLLLMILNDYGINPLTDWDLYRTLKDKAARIVRKMP
jgi:hypothetical protein